MCGIAGYYNATVQPDQIEKLIGSLRHRGPDDQGVYRHNQVGIVHTRLSIIELSSLGAQPYRFENLVLAFNGELYNYKEVREVLKKLGYSFDSNSDTEVLIKAFHCWNVECIHHFIGMFAFVVYNELTDEMFLFRDRVGVKPLYFSFENGRLFFASELKALAAFEFPRDVNVDAVFQYFRFGFIPQPMSVYNSVSKLEPGHYLKISRKSGFTKKRYWNLNFEITANKREEDWADELENLLISAFRYRMVSDVPVGVFLSGGIDSSLLTAILQKHHGGIHTFTIGFNELAFDESSFAAKVANHLKTTHTQKTLQLGDARKWLDRFYNIYDEPFADTSGIPTSFVTLLAKENGMKVVLSADGGDELFGGYTHYQRAYSLFHKFSRLPMGVRNLVAKTIRQTFPRSIRKKVFPFNLEHKAYAVEELLNAENPVAFFENFLANQAMDEVSRMINAASATNLSNNHHGLAPLQSMMAWDFSYYLPEDLLTKVDRATMYHSLECRDPFLDHRIVEFAMRVPLDLKFREGKGKYLLRKILKKYVPEEFFERKKQGFSIPIFEWFKTDLDKLFQEYLLPEKVKDIPFLDPTEIDHEYKKYLYYKNQGKEYNIEKMWRMLSFMLWWDKYMGYGR